MPSSSSGWARRNALRAWPVPAPDHSASGALARDDVRAGAAEQHRPLVTRSDAPSTASPAVHARAAAHPRPGDLHGRAVRPATLMQLRSRDAVRAAILSVVHAGGHLPAKIPRCSGDRQGAARSHFHDFRARGRSRSPSDARRHTAPKGAGAAYSTATRGRSPTIPMPPATTPPPPLGLAIPIRHFAIGHRAQTHSSPRPQRARTASSGRSITIASYFHAGALPGVCETPRVSFAPLEAPASFLAKQHARPPRLPARFERIAPSGVIATA